MSLHTIFLFGAVVTTVAILIPIIRFANRTVKIRQIWDSALDANSLSRNR